MLKKLFTSKNRVKILQYFFQHESGRIRAISKQCLISPSAVKREADNLISLGILLKDKNGLTVNNACSFIDDLKNIFIKTDLIVIPIINELKKLKKISFALIFGSFARGSFSAESDVDILIIGDSHSKEVYHRMDNIEKKIKRSVNPILMQLSELKSNKKSTLIRDILKKKIIMLVGDENEFRKVAQ
ncbi:MAG TPA: nucleotidyltransferase domain-containing protein [Candidatus Nanoarchaeia archaeon]|nr:nucleotidyltransferase domain-containing protein [Candidatus Nanoarchaeia archaeon]